MDSQRFDHIASTFAAGQTRRGACRLLGVAAVGALGLSVLGADESDARRRRGKKHGKKHGKKGKGKNNQRCLKSGDLCETDKQCCGNNQICEVPFNASNSDTRCCGAQGAVCGGVNDDGDAQPPFCCIGEAGVRSFVCSESDPNNPGVRGACLPAPEEI